MLVPANLYSQHVDYGIVGWPESCFTPKSTKFDIWKHFLPEWHAVSYRKKLELKMVDLDYVYTTPKQNNSGRIYVTVLTQQFVNLNFTFEFTVLRPGAGCIKKWLKLTMISGNVNQSEPRILYLITI